MHTIPDDAAFRVQRRKHSAEFKAQVVAACRPLGVSTAAVSMAYGLNANMVRRWIVEAHQPSGAHPAPAETPAVPAFIPLCQEPVEPSSADIRIELRRGATAISVNWPSEAAAQCAAWMRELLR